MRKMLPKGSPGARGVIATVFFAALCSAAPSLAAELKGKVQTVMGSDVVISVADSSTVAAGDRVELSFSIGEDVVPVGTWKVTNVRENGLVEARPDGTDSVPDLGYDAVIHATGRSDKGKKDTDRGKKGRGEATPKVRTDSPPTGIAPDQRDVFAMYEYMELNRITTMCSDGDAESCADLGWKYRKGDGVAKDYGRAVEFLEKGCRGGDATGCNRLGIMFSEGLGTAQDLRRAVELYEKACAGGEAVACRNAGNKYKRGEGVPQDTRRTVAYYEKACEGSDFIGCNSLGLLYDNGRLVPQDYPRALQLYKMACDRRIAMSCANLGLLYEYGRGTAKDLGEAVRLYREGCDGGNARSCFFLGTMYYEGQGVAADKSKGKELMQEGCSMGDEWSCKKLAGYN